MQAKRLRNLAHVLFLPISILISVSLDKAYSKEAGLSEDVSTQSEYSFSETVRRLRIALEDKNLTIFATIDQREAARSVGLDMPPTTLLIYGNPKGGTPLMLAAPDFALELPLKVLVREATGGKTLVIYTPAAALEGKHGLPAGMAARLGAAESLIAAAVTHDKQ